MVLSILRILDFGEKFIFKIVHFKQLCWLHQCEAFIDLLHLLCLRILFRFCGHCRIYHPFHWSRWSRNCGMNISFFFRLIDCFSLSNCNFVISEFIHVNEGVKINFSRLLVRQPWCLNQLAQIFWLYVRVWSHTTTHFFTVQNRINMNNFSKYNFVQICQINWLKLKTI